MRARSALLGPVLALLVAGCSAVGGIGNLFSGNSLVGKGATAVADNGSDIYKAADKMLSGPAYCEKAGSTQVYKLDSGDCATGDTSLKSWQYNQIKADNEAHAFQQLHAAALAEAATPTYCRTAISHMAYRPASGQCQAGEEKIGQEEYTAARTEAAAAATKIP